MNKPLIAIPMGDPAGIGPEIVVKAIADEQVQKTAVCLVIGDQRVLARAMQICELPLRIHPVTSPDQVVDEAGVLNLIDLANADPEVFTIGQVSALCGQAAFEYIAKSIELANAKTSRCRGHNPHQ